MKIQLKPEQEQFIQSRLASGRYENSDDVIALALKLLEEWEEKTRKKIAIGLAQIEVGEVLERKVVIARLEDKLRQALESQE
ncbi:MAG: type II toxin-antitoxin system ParD family antitoxin [Nodularia sp. CChRGM 3473]